MNPAFANLVASRLTPAEQQELLDVTDYLREKAYTPSNQMPEGSAASLINRASPNVRSFLRDFSNALETPRNRPFDAKWSESDYAEAAGMDPAATCHVKAALDGQEVAARLQQRMGTDADLPLVEPTHRDILSAAYDLHTQPQPQPQPQPGEPA